MLNPTYPGVYVEEIPSSVRTIGGVSTSATAFIGFTRRGPMNEPVRIFNFGEFERTYGGLDAESELSYAVQQFFLNGGSEAWIVRVAGPGDDKKAPAAATAVLVDEASKPVFAVRAVDEGKWGDNLRVDVEPGDQDTFNLVVSEMATIEGRPRAVVTETFRNLAVAGNDPRHAVAVVNDGSKLVRLSVPDKASTERPRVGGTLSALIADDKIGGITLKDKVIKAKLNAGADREIKIPAEPDVPADATPAARAAAIAALLQTSLRSFRDNATNQSDFAGATVTPLRGKGGWRFQVRAGNGEAKDVITLTEPKPTGLGFGGADSAKPEATSLTGGFTGARATGDVLVGDRNAKKGLFALENVDVINILCVPETMYMGDVEAANVAAQATAYAAERRAFYILDVPKPETRKDPVKIAAWLDQASGLRHKNVAVYYPRPFIADPRNEFRLRAVAPSGTIAGLYARTDAERGVWKAPAGSDAVLRGVQKLEYLMTDAENGTLNPVGLNCLRTLSIYGTVSWGARTMDGSDQKASEWKYVPVRRTALMIEESLYRGLKWAVFEPNDEPLWSQIRLNAGSFMHGLFRQGAFQGASPKEAYFVKCDKETTTQDDVNRGIVNVLVGFAPLKPAEFVIIKLSQIAGQVDT